MVQLHHYKFGFLTQNSEEPMQRRLVSHHTLQIARISTFHGDVWGVRTLLVFNSVISGSLTSVFSCYITHIIGDLSAVMSICANGWFILICSSHIEVSGHSGAILDIWLGGVYMVVLQNLQGTSAQTVEGNSYNIHSGLIYGAHSALFKYIATTQCGPLYRPES